MANSNMRNKLDRFWAALFLTPEGRPKSATLLYSFCLSLLFMTVYGICYFFLIDVIENAFTGSTAGMRNVAEAVIPGLAGSLLCCSLWFAFKDKRLVPAAYIWLTFFAVAALVAMALICEAEEYSIFIYFFLLIVPTGLITGASFTHYMWGRQMKREAAGEENA